MPVILIIQENKINLLINATFFKYFFYFLELFKVRLGRNDSRSNKQSLFETDEVTVVY